MCSDADSDDDAFLRQLGRAPPSTAATATTAGETAPSPLTEQLVRSQELTELLGGVNTVDEAIEAVRYLLQQSNSAEESASLAAAQSKEIERLRASKQRLEKKLDCCEEKCAQMEIRLARGEVNQATTKVLRLAKHPNNLQRKTPSADAQTQTEPMGNDTGIEEEIQKLRLEAENSQKGRDRLIEVFKKRTDQFRDDCFQLLGYRIDFLAEQREYRLRSMYSSGPHKELLFRRSRDGAMQVLDTPFVQQLSPKTVAKLTESQSIPVFLSQVLLDTFESQRSQRRS